jgi:hypothetical protein
MPLKTNHVLTDISNSHGIKAFINKEYCCETLAGYLNTEYKNEAKILIRIARAGYISNIVKSNRSKEIILRQLHEDESIDKEIAMQLVNDLFDVISQVKLKEAAIVGENKKNAIIAENLERELKEQKLHDVLDISLKKIINSYGYEILNDYNTCRALLKDMANGDFVDEITVISLLFEKNIQKDKRLNRRLFRKSMEGLSMIYFEKYFKNYNADIDIKLIIHIVIKNIFEIKSTNEGSVKKWIANSFGFLKK